MEEGAAFSDENTCSLFLLRHGETNFNRDGIIQGTLDSSVLTEKGWDQARAAGRFLATQPAFDKVFVSPMTRARQTAQAVTLEMEAAGNPLPQTQTIVPEIREIELHEWQGQKKSDLAKADPQAYEAWNLSPTTFQIGDRGTQSWTCGRYPVVDLWRRAKKGWGEIFAGGLGPSAAAGFSPGVRVLMVAHGAVNQALLCSAFGLGPEHFRKFPWGNTDIAEVVWSIEEQKALKWRWIYKQKSEVFFTERDMIAAQAIELAENV
eukprot:CAMPEP_0113939454 /NCGR_PEP_ID=MMETSP1339-20121228/5763_1 /TAXON_ID=94617 /ORGANISM="Fibrocapsa japonica" /LENGTH=262 /DNA_ID=CAMNT_0000942961 /DNA_START=47 /DNA_END=835 /DNA_ORIENTATION=+ /assembly_acc=CAM_ASM_000762